MPMMIEAMKQPASEPRPPNTTTTNTIGPMRVGHARLGGLVVAADHAGQAGQQAAAGEHHGEHHAARYGRARSTMLGWVSAAWMIRPMRVFFSSSQVQSSMPAETSSMKPR